MGSGNSQPQVIFVNRKKKLSHVQRPIYWNTLILAIILISATEEPLDYTPGGRSAGSPADLPSQTAISEGSLSQENCTLCSHPYLAPGRAKNFCTLRASLEEAFKSNLHLSLGNSSPRLGWKSLEHPRSILVLRFKKYSHLWLMLCSSPELAFLFHNVVRNKT